MTEQAVAAPGGQETAAAPEQQTSQEDATQEQQPKTYDEAYVADLRKEAAKYRTEAKGLKTEIDKIRTSSMSETEKAIAEAEARGRTATVQEFGTRLARTEFDAQAGRRNPEADTNAVLEFLDLKQFVDDSGEPDVKKIAAAVERLVPEAPKEPGRQPSFDSGSRTTAPTGQSFSDIIRKQAGH